MSKVIVGDLLRHLQGDDEFLKVEVQLLSGPTNFKARRR